MKKLGKFLISAALIAAMCVPLAACNATPDSSSSDGGTGNGDATKDNTWLGYDEFAEDPDRRPDRGEYVDTTPEEEEGAVLTPYSFEFENAKFGGITNKQDHLCVANSFEFNTAFGGNICMKNIASGTTFTFTVQSDKNVRSELLIRCSDFYADQSFGNGYTVTVNGKPVVDTDVFVPSGGEQAPGANTYFRMVTLDSKISLFEGKNKIVFKSNTAYCPNVDGFTIRTSASLQDQTEGSWPAASEFMTVSTMPTDTASGQVTYTCEEGSHASSPAATKKTLPALTDSVYEVEDTAEGTEYYLTVLGEKFQVAQSTAKRYTLTLQDGATLKDGSASGKVVEGATPEIVYEVPQGYRFVCWENVNDNSETYERAFAMPSKDLTLKPVVEQLTAKTLTLQGATFAGGETSKSVMPYESVDLTLATSAPEGKVHTGWYNVNDRTETFDKDFVMPDKALTIAPVFDVEAYASTSTSAATDGTNDGKVQLYPKEGLWRSDKATVALESATLGVVGNEMGMVYKCKSTTKGGKIAQGAFGMTQNPYRIAANQTYSSTVTVQNFGDEEITLQFWVTGSSTTPRPSGNGSEEVTLQKGEVKTISFTFTFTGANNNEMFVFDLRNADGVDALYIGLYQYISLNP